MGRRPAPQAVRKSRFVTAPGQDELPWDDSTASPPCLPAGPTPWGKAVLLARVFEKQNRGVLHVHPVLGFKTPAERHAAHLYAAYLAQYTNKYGFGFSERRLSSASGKRVAAYLSSYFVIGKKRKATLQESVMAPDMPRSIIHVSTALTQATGVTMRELRFRRFVWFLSDRTGCGLEEAREIATRAAANSLDLGVDVFTPSPRFLAQVLGREPPLPSSME